MDPTNKRSRITRENAPPPATNTFNFRLRSARELRLAIKALSDSAFNPLGFGRVDVNETDGFEITVFNSDNAEAAHLQLKPSDFLHSRILIRKPVEGKIVSLLEITKNFNEWGDGPDELTVFQVDGSDKITFLLTGNLSESREDHIPVKKFYAEFQNNQPEIPKFPTTACFSWGALGLNDLQLMIDSHPDSVSCSMKDCVASIISESEEEFWKKFNLLGKSDPGEPRHGRFKWRYDELLLTASLLVATSHLWTLRVPPNKILLRFRLSKDPLGILEFMVAADMICRDLKD